MLSGSAASVRLPLRSTCCGSLAPPQGCHFIMSPSSSSWSHGSSTFCTAFKRMVTARSSPQLAGNAQRRRPFGLTACGQTRDVNTEKRYCGWQAPQHKPLPRLRCKAYAGKPGQLLCAVVTNTVVRRPQSLALCCDQMPRTIALNPSLYAGFTAVAAVTRGHVRSPAGGVGLSCECAPTRVDAACLSGTRCNVASRGSRGTGPGQLTRERCPSASTKTL